MKILLVSQYFSPEPFIINDLVKTLVDQGHEVVVYTGKPNYPDGDIYEDYVEAGFSSEIFYDKVKVYRVPLKPRGSGSAKKLILNYLSFVFSGVKYLKKIEDKNFDVIFAFGLSPITSVIPAIFLKRKLGSKLTLWVQDLWPESLVATGYVKSKILLYPISLMVKWIYKNCDHILVQSNGFKVPVSKHTDKELIYYPNSIKIKKDEVEVNLPLELEKYFDENFCLVFAGNLGKAQALDIILNAAENLTDLDNFKIILVGSGSLSKWLMQQKDLRQLNNIELVGRYPMDVMPAIFKRSDGLIVTLSDNEIINYTIPSKIQSYLSSGKPIIGALNGEGAAVINDSQCGFTSQADCSLGLEKSIRRLFHLTKVERSELGLNGLNYFHENFNMDVQVSNLVGILSSH
jgi:glycosyltransferase involved in cell wall biosynthesis